MNPSFSEEAFPESTLAMQTAFMRWERNQDCEARNYEGDRLAWTHGSILQTSMAVTMQFPYP